jgi:8-hydroxy-5-deazaflavin:NADPH oxidoreductase
VVVGIIGSGMIGSTVARLATQAGHSVIISNSRGPGSLRSLVTELGPLARAGTVREAIESGDIVVIAVPFRDREKLFSSGVNFHDKIVVDAMNPYTADFKIMDLGERGSAELVAQELPGARVVKALNTLYYDMLAKSARPSGSAERIVVPIAGDDKDAKRTVASFIDSIGYDPLDLGSLKNGRKQEPNTALYNKPLNLEQARVIAQQ